MGFISDIKAINEVQKIKKGQIGHLSISQIIGLIVNMFDAKNKLNDEDFKKVYKLFNDLRKCNTKLEMNYDGYCKNAVDIIKKFDALAPYEKYSGGNELEFSFFMDEIGEADLHHEDSYISEEIQEYANVVANESKGTLTVQETIYFAQILNEYLTVGKEEVLQKFEKYVEEILENDNPPKAIFKAYYLVGILNKNNIITEEEMKKMSQDYREKIINKIKNK